MNPADLPCAQELFAQWQRARGGRSEPASRPFSRGWEDLLEDARLVSAAERSEAERDAKNLEADGWVKIKCVRYKAHLIERIVLPLECEARWRDAFGFVPPSNEEMQRIREFAWEPELCFLREARLNIPFSELKQLNEFIKDRNHEPILVPIKERSLQIFGDEKRLDALVSSSLFRSGRLDLNEHLSCEIIGVPMAWKRGPSAAAGQPIIVLENAATWHSYCRWNSQRALFSAVVYGDGNRFADGIQYLPDIFAELGGPRRILYFGDLDPQGVLIPQEGSARAQGARLPPVEPHLWSYTQLLSLGAGHGQPWDGEPPSSTLCDWLGSCADSAKQLFARRQRLAQEHIGWEFLRNRSVMD
jgi:hypothetical protein